ncbi:MAG: RIP metalloprotease RseP [Verrucomicrobiales bacterium]
MPTLLEILKLIGVIFMALMILNVMILVHEWGHFLAARWRGLKVDKFQIWFGKPIWKKTYNGVQYGLGCIPAGGFVALPQMAPMEAIEGRSENEEPLPPIKPLDKIIVAVAGPLFSFMLAVVFAFLVWMAGRPIMEPENPTQIGYIRPDMPVAQSGLRVGDIICKIDGKPVNRWEGQVSSVRWGIVSSEKEKTTFTVERNGQLMDFDVAPIREEPKAGSRNWAARTVEWIFGRPPLRQVGLDHVSTTRVDQVLPNSPAAEAGIKEADVVSAVDGDPVQHHLQLIHHIQKGQGQPVKLSLQRGTEVVEVTVTPRRPDKPKDAQNYMTGIAFGQERRPMTYLHQTPFEQIRESVQAMKNLLGAITSRKSDISASHMGGPVMIVRIYTNFLSVPDAWRWILWFSVILNVNLAVLNMLPFPVLDGGHITMAVIEWIRRRPLNVRVLEYVQTACVLLVFSFFIMVTLKDVGDLAIKDKDVEFFPRSAQPQAGTQ